MIHQVALAAGVSLYPDLTFKAATRLPDLPTTGELGYKKLDSDFWHMLLAPAGTPRPIIDRLNSALRAALGDARVQKTSRTAAWTCFRPQTKRPRPPSATRPRDQAVGRVIRANHIAGGT